MTTGHVHLTSRKLMALQQWQGELRVLMSPWELVDLEKQGRRQGAGERSAGYLFKQWTRGAGTGWVNQSPVFFPFLVASLVFEQSSFARKF